MAAAGPITLLFAIALFSVEVCDSGLWKTKRSNCAFDGENLCSLTPGLAETGINWEQPGTAADALLHKGLRG